MPASSANAPPMISGSSNPNLLLNAAWIISESFLLRVVMLNAARNILCLSAQSATLSENDERSLPAKNFESNKVNNNYPDSHKSQLRPDLSKVLALGSD